MKKLINNLMLILMLISLFPTNVFAANDTKIAVQYDGSKYLIFPSRACTYELSASGTIAPVTFNQMYDNPNDVIEVTATNVSSSARYLWIDGNDDPYDLQAYTALNNSEIDYIDNTMKRITIKPVVEGDRIITLTKVENYSDYKYILVKVEKGSQYDQLVTRTESLDPTVKISDPYTGLTKMLSFKESYDALLPVATDAKWQSVPANGIIEEPLDTKTGDIYVVWLMANKNGTPVFDMQIMYCLRRDEKIITKVEKMPQTGISYLLNGLLVANIAILPIIYFKKRKLVNN